MVGPALFSDGSTLTRWLERNGAPILPKGHVYRLSITGNKPQAVTATIHEDFHSPMPLATFTEYVRVDTQMAAIAACKHAYEGLTP